MIFSIFSYNINWPNENQPFCKIRNYISTICFAMATWTLVGASIDRYLCSSVSVRYRQLSTVRTARRLLIITLSVFTLIFAEIFYCYEASVPNVPLPCYPESLSCQLYNNWMTILFINIIPSIFMAIFSLLTIRNIRARVVRPIKNRTVSINTSRNNLRVHINDRNISQMLLIQVSFKFLSFLKKKTSKIKYLGFGSFSSEHTSFNSTSIQQFNSNHSQKFSSSINRKSHLLCNCSTFLL
jgi:hypothetical protein